MDENEGRLTDLQTLRDLGSGASRALPASGAGPDKKPEKPNSPTSRVLGHLTARGGTVGAYQPSRLAEHLAEHGVATLCAVIDAAAQDPWYRQRPDRLRPEVIFTARQIALLLPKAPVPKAPVRTLARTCADLPAGESTPGGTCAWCNEPMRFVWNGAEYDADPEHAACLAAAHEWDAERMKPRAP